MADHYAVTDTAEPLARLRDIAEHIDRLAEALDDYCYDGTANEIEFSRASAASSSVSNFPWILMPSTAP